MIHWFQLGSYSAPNRNQSLHPSQKKFNLPNKSDNQTNLLLKFLIAREIQYILRDASNLEGEFNNIMRTKFSEENFEYYYSKLKNIRIKKFEEVRQYYNRLQSFVTKINLCDTEDKTLRNRKIFDIFYIGLNQKQQTIIKKYAIYYRLRVVNLQTGIGMKNHNARSCWSTMLALIVGKSGSSPSING